MLLRVSTSQGSRIRLPGRFLIRCSTGKFQFVMRSVLIASTCKQTTLLRPANVHTEGQGHLQLRRAGSSEFWSLPTLPVPMTFFYVSFVASIKTCPFTRFLVTMRRYCRIVAAEVLARLATEMDIAAVIVEQDCLLHLVSLLRLPHKPGVSPVRTCAFLL